MKVKGLSTLIGNPIKVRVGQPTSKGNIVLFPNVEELREKYKEIIERGNKPQ